MVERREAGTPVFVHAEYTVRSVYDERYAEYRFALVFVGAAAKHEYYCANCCAMTEIDHKTFGPLGDTATPSNVKMRQYFCRAITKNKKG